VVGLVIPSIIAHLTPSGSSDRRTIGAVQLHEVSAAVAVILLVSYVAFVAFSVFGLHAERSGVEFAAGEPAGDGEPAPNAETMAAQRRRVVVAPRHPQAPEASPSVTARRGGNEALTARVMSAWEQTVWAPAIVLAAVTVLTALASEVLVGSIEPV